MKTTLDLPEEVVRQLERRAARGGRKPDQIAADVLAANLSEPSEGDPQSTTVVPKHLPLIKARSAPPADARSMTPQQTADWIKEIDLEQEVERFERSLGHQYVDRVGG